MSCETCSEFYDLAPFVVRHYHDDTCDTRRVMTIPMGTIKPLNSSVQTDTLAASRKYVWSFASSHRNGAREQMVRWLRSNKYVVRVQIFHLGTFVVSSSKKHEYFTHTHTGMEASNEDHSEKATRRKRRMIRSGTQKMKATRKRTMVTRTMWRKK